MQKILETERLYLCEMSLDYAPWLLALNGDPDVIRYTGDPFPWTTVEATKEIIQTVIFPQYENKIGRWAVHLKENDQFLGWCGLKDVGDYIDLGYRYFKDQWGKGYATEAALAVLQYGIRNKIPNIVGRADAENKASIHVLEKIGLEFAGMYVENENGKEVQSVKYICTRS